jgi:hypothetical protein
VRDKIVVVVLMFEDAPIIPHHRQEQLAPEGVRVGALPDSASGPSLGRRRLAASRVSRRSAGIEFFASYPVVVGVEVVWVAGVALEFCLGFLLR